MKKNTRKLKKAVLLLCSAVLLVCISIGATVAYLTSQDTVTNTFTVGNVAITMDEAKVGADGKAITGDAAERVKANAYKLFPGGEYDKDPTIHVGTTSEEAYLGVKVVFKDGKKADNLGLNLLGIFDGFSSSSWTISEKQISGNDVYYTLIYNTTISGGTNDIVLFNKVKIPGELDNDDIALLDNVQMEITAYAVQKDGFNSAAKALSTAFEGVFPAPAGA